MSDEKRSTDSEREATDVLPPNRLLAGKYRLGRLLGEGGMGAVYEAEHTGLGARVAVKLLSEGAVLDPRSNARFRREARAMGAVRHDNVVSVMDTGTDEDGTLFLVMEFLEGESLSSLLRRERRLAPARAVGIASQILSGLQAAHRKGVVHRDLKPGNIFIVRQPDGSQRVKVLDFGVSKLGDASQTLNVTADGVLVGTPNFMAPEQVQGRTDIDGRADLYAVGVMLYRMVAGKLPFVASSSEELYRRILAGEPRKPRDHRPELSLDLERVILTSMAVDREDRYRDAKSFRAALQRASPSLFGDSAIMARSPPPDSPDAAQAAPTPAQEEEVSESQETRAARPSVLRSKVPEAVRETEAIRGRRRGPSALLALLTAAVLIAAGVLAMWKLMARGPEQAEREEEVVTAPSGPPLVFAVIQYLPREQVEKRHKPLAEYLEEALDRPVSLVIAVDHDDLRRRLLAAEVDLAALSPWNYVRAKREAPGLRLLASPVGDGGASSYEGVILARADSGIDALEDLEGKTFCYVDPGSSSGYFFPRAVMRQKGFDPDEFLGAKVFGRDHLSTLRLLSRGACEGASLGASFFYAGAEHGLPPQSFQMLASTPRINTDAYCAPASMPEDQAVSIREALLALEPGSERARRLLEERESAVVGFVEADDAEFDGVREIEHHLLDGPIQHPDK